MRDLIAKVVKTDRLMLSEKELKQTELEGLLAASHHHPDRPRGQRLSFKVVGPYDDRHFEVSLVPHFDDLVETLPVPVPEQVTRYHPAVRHFLDHDARSITKELRPRAARILQALVDEAPRRGLTVSGPVVPAGVTDTYTTREIERGHIVLRSTAGFYPVRIWELTTRVPRPKDSTKTRRTPSCVTEPLWDDVPDGRLQLVVEGPGTAHAGNRYADSATLTVEDRLPRVFRRIETLRLESEWRDRDRARRQEERQRRWEGAMAEARVLYDEEARWQSFEGASRAWREVAAHREFLAAALAAADTYQGPERAAILAQLDLAERRIQRIDPVGRPELLAPVVPDPTPDQLKPFLRGWDPHGPGTVW